MSLSSIQKNEIAIEYNQWQFVLSPSVSLSGETINPDYENYEGLYSWVLDEKTRKLISLMHSKFVTEFKAMNTRLPTKDDTAYFWAENSRQLLGTIETSEKLIGLYKNTAEAFAFDPKISECVNLCKDFLEQYRGSTIPPHTEKMPVYLELPIFIKSDRPVILEPENIQTIDVAYVRGLFERTQDDFINGHFDSVITKCRTLLEEVFCYAIEKSGNTPSTSGRINELFNQVKDSYNMRQGPGNDNRVNDLVNGLWKIIESVASFRNIGSDSHGVGRNRLTIREHHAMVYLNAAITVATFIVSIADNANP